MPSLHQYVNPPSRSGRGQFPAVMRGTITAITTASEVWVTIPTLGGDPMQAVNTVPGDLNVGDPVVLGVADGRADSIIVLTKEAPTVPAHTHPEGDIAYTGWADLPLQSPWGPGTTADMYPGLRYRADNRFVHLNGHITGGPGTIATLPFTIGYETRIAASLTNGGSAFLRIVPSGAISSTATTTFYVHGYAPLT